MAHMASTQISVVKHLWLESVSLAISCRGQHIVGRLVPPKPIPSRIEGLNSLCGLARACTAYTCLMRLFKETPAIAAARKVVQDRSCMGVWLPNCLKDGRLGG